MLKYPKRRDVCVDVCMSVTINHSGVQVLMPLSKLLPNSKSFTLKQQHGVLALLQSLLCHLLPKLR